MNPMIHHSRDICLYLYRHKLVYAIPLYLEQERNIFRTNYLELEVNVGKTTNFILSQMKPRTVITNNVETKNSFYDLEGCCEKK